MQRLEVSGAVLQIYGSLISDFRRDLNIENVLLGISPASNCQFDAGEIPKRTFSIYGSLGVKRLNPME